MVMELLFTTSLYHLWALGRAWLTFATPMSRRDRLKSSRLTPPTAAAAAAAVQIEYLVQEGGIKVLGELLKQSSMVMMALEGLERILQVRVTLTGLCFHPVDFELFLAKVMLAVAQRLMVPGKPWGRRSCSSAPAIFFCVVDVILSVCGEMFGSETYTSWQR